jgi:aspartate beta-hydroxylase
MGLTYDLAASAVRKVYDARISGPPVLATTACFPAARGFVDAWPAIAAEARHVAMDILAVPRFHELMPEQACISTHDDRDWRMFVLKAYRVPISGNLARCPVLTRLLATTPEVLSAAFSFLAPGKHVPPHRGPFRGVLRFHLMLSMPLDHAGMPASVLSIAGHEHRLAEGDCLLWDDTYPHEVANRGDRIRTALLLDVRRPGMPWDMALLSRLVVGLVGTSIRLQRSLRMAMEGVGCRSIRHTRRSTDDGTDEGWRAS